MPQFFLAGWIEIGVVLPASTQPKDYVISELKVYFTFTKYVILKSLPSRELTYPTWGKGKSSSKVPLKGDMLVPWRVTGWCWTPNLLLICSHHQPPSFRLGISPSSRAMPSSFASQQVTARSASAARKFPYPFGVYYQKFKQHPPPNKKNLIQYYHVYKYRIYILNNPWCNWVVFQFSCPYHRFFSLGPCLKSCNSFFLCSLHEENE